MRAELNVKTRDACSVQSSHSW